MFDNKHFTRHGQGKGGGSQQQASNTSNRPLTSCQLVLPAWPSLEAHGLTLATVGERRISSVTQQSSTSTHMHIHTEIKLHTLSSQPTMANQHLVYKSKTGNSHLFEHTAATISPKTCYWSCLATLAILPNFPSTRVHAPPSVMILEHTV